MKALLQIKEKHELAENDLNELSKNVKIISKKYQTRI